MITERNSTREDSSLDQQGSGTEAALREAREAKRLCIKSGDMNLYRYWLYETVRLELRADAERRGSTTIVLSNPGSDK